jgi:hypothetical protein
MVFSSLCGGAPAAWVTPLRKEQAILLNKLTATLVNRAYGALADDPIERPPELPWAEHDEIE